MPRLRPMIAVVQVALVAGLGYGLISGRLPLGVAGEWEWHWLTVSPRALDVALAMAGVAGFAGFAALGGRALAARAGWRREAAWLAALAGLAPVVQVVVLSGAPMGYGLTKWITLGMPDTSGYYNIARVRMRDPRKFWADYPVWIKDQDSLHIGTHPPGLFLLARGTFGLMKSRPALARAIDRQIPFSVAEAFRRILGPISTADRAALAALGALALLACAATVAPLYALGRASGLSAEASWSSAALWPLVPSAILFQPAFDVTFPVLATTALALAARGRVGSAIGAGLALGLGMQFTLAFLPVGLVAGLLLATSTGGFRRRAALVLATGAGFLGFTAATWAVSGANPFVIWWWNQRNHARFYEEFPRDYLAWVVANPIELAVAVGLPVLACAAVGLRRAPRACWLTLAVLALLNLSGRNLSEVARLWLPLMPPILLAAGAGLERLGGRGGMLGLTAGMLGGQAILLQSAIQVVYPV